MPTIPSPTYYVYVLARPNGKVFYVGKGKGKRILDHEREAHGGCECHKCRVIRKIWHNGGEVQRYTVFTTDNSQDALKHEVELIARYGRENLTNQTDGGDGTYMPGDQSPTAKLTWAQVDEIRRRFVSESTHIRDIAADYGVSHHTIKRIVYGELWKDRGALPLKRSPEQRHILHGGEHSGNAKLTWDQVRSIREQWNTSHVTLRELAQRYGIAVENMSTLVLNKSWYDPEYTPNHPAPERHGEYNNCSRTTWEQVREIRARFTAREMSRPQFVEAYGLSFGCITKIVYNQSWHDPSYTPPTDKWKPNYKLNLDKAREIRALYASGGTSYNKLARAYGVSLRAIESLIHGDHWPEPE